MPALLAGSGNFETGDRHGMAPRRVQIVLALEVERIVVGAAVEEAQI
jgi:hypothetical protein